MSNLPPQPSFEQFQDNDPYMETLYQISDRYVQLTRLDKRTAYVREAKIHAGDPDNPIRITTSARGNVDNFDNSTTFISIPSLNSKDREPRPYFEATVINTGPVIQGWLSTAHDSVSTHAELSAWLDRDDLPDSVTAMLTQLALMHMTRGEDSDVVTMTSGQYSELWDSVQKVIDESATPQIVSEWRPIENFKTTPNENVYSVTADHAMKSAYEHGDLLAASLTTDAYDLSIKRLANGSLLYRYYPLKQRPVFPELTDEERARHPHVIVAVKDIQPPEEKNEIIASYTAPGHVPYEKRFKDGYAVIEATVTKNARHIETTYFETKAEAQEYADALYKEQLAIERGVYDLTPERAQQVLQTLNNLLNIIKLERQFD